VNASLALDLLPGRLAICRFGAGDPLPAWALHAGAEFYSIVRTREELSLVCAEDDLPPSRWDAANRGWRAFKLQGPIPFETVGVVSRISGALADAGVPVFVVSTWDTDYVLVKEETAARAVDALRRRFTVRAGAAEPREGGPHGGGADRGAAAEPRGEAS
jgi:hypothetical protein